VYLLVDCKWRGGRREENLPDFDEWAIGRSTNVWLRTAEFRFAPSVQEREDHFRVHGPTIEGTASDGPYAQVLAMNDPPRLDLRLELLMRGDFP
jgi:hypothetical protein